MKAINFCSQDIEASTYDQSRDDEETSDVSRERVTFEQATA